MNELTKELIQHSLDKDYNKASNVFGELMTVKISDILDQEKIKLADQIYNGVDGAEDEEQLDLDLDLDNGDEELSDESAEVEDSDEEYAGIDDETDDEFEEDEEE